MSEIEQGRHLGSGIMGSGLAEVAARAGYDVVVRSRTHGMRPNAMVASIDKGFAKAIERGKATEDERDAGARPHHATDHLGAVADCDLVIESVVEDLAVKKALFAELEQIVKPERHPRHQHLHPARGRPGDGHLSARTRCAASTSSTRRR